MNFDFIMMFKVELDFEIIISYEFVIIFKQEKVNKAQSLLINVTGKSSGFYYLKLITNKGNMNKKFNF